MERCPVTQRQWEEWISNPVTLVYLNHLSTMLQQQGQRLTDCLWAGHPISEQVQRDFHSRASVLHEITTLTYRAIAVNYPATLAEIEAQEEREATE